MMNVRIEELLEQATTSIKDEYGHWIGSELDEEKFAELIVRECAWVADMGYAAPGTQIKQHFGVEQ
jgi:hypothetical protein